MWAGPLFLLVLRLLLLLLVLLLLLPILTFCVWMISIGRKKVRPSPPGMRGKIFRTSIWFPLSSLSLLRVPSFPHFSLFFWPTNFGKESQFFDVYRPLPFCPKIGACLGIFSQDCFFPDLNVGIQKLPNTPSALILKPGKGRKEEEEKEEESGIVKLGGMILHSLRRGRRPTIAGEVVTQ